MVGVSRVARLGPALYWGGAGGWEQPFRRVRAAIIVVSDGVGESGTWARSTRAGRFIYWLPFLGKVNNNNSSFLPLPYFAVSCSSQL